MYPFTLYSDDSLNLFKDYARSCFIDWSKEWFARINGRIEIMAINAFLTPDNERQNFVFDQSIDHEQVLTSQTNDIKILFSREYIDHVAKDDFDYELYKNSYLLQQVVSDSVNGFIDKLSGANRDAPEARSDKSLMFKKGYGSVILILSNVHYRAEILLGPSFMRQIVLAAAKDSVPSEPLNKIDLSAVHASYLLEVRAYLSPTEINIKELSSLSVGDVLVLDHGISENVNIYVNDSLMCKGVVGKSNDLRTIQIKT